MTSSSLSDLGLGELGDLRRRCRYKTALSTATAPPRITPADSNLLRAALGGWRGRGGPLKTNSFTAPPALGATTSVDGKDAALASVGWLTVSFGRTGTGTLGATSFSAPLLDVAAGVRFSSAMRWGWLGIAAGGFGDCRVGTGAGASSRAMVVPGVEATLSSVASVLPPMSLQPLTESEKTRSKTALEVAKF
jgi:hypothetical protein